MSGLGWLDYGAVDSSILLQHPLTSNPAAYFATKGGVAVSGSGLQTFDPVKGMCPNGSGGFYLWNLAGLANLDFAGQITYEVEREFLCRQSATDFSFGYVPAVSEYCMSASPTTGGSINLCNKNLAGGGSIGVGVSGGFITAYVDSGGKSDFVRVNIGWNGGRVGGSVWLAIDGVVIGSATRNAATLVSMFANIYIGSDRQIAGNYMAIHHIRNLQISTKPPMLSVTPALRNIGMISDSINNSDDVFNGPSKDVVTSWSMRRELANAGLDVGKVTWSNEGGARLDNSTNGGASFYIYNQLAACLATNPTMMIIRGGTNDSLYGRTLDTTWQAVVASYITACLERPSVRIVMFLGIPSMSGDTVVNTVAVQSNRALGDTKIKAACDAWRAANPTDPRKVIFVDSIYENLGGETPAPGTYIGQVSGLYTDLHLSGYGHHRHGGLVALAIIDALR